MKNQPSTDPNSGAIAASESRRRFLQRQTVSELSSTLTPDQRMLLSLFALSHVHRMDLREMLVAISSERPSRINNQLLLPLSDGETPLKALQQVDHLLPSSVLKVLQLADQNNALTSFWEAWLEHHPDDEFNTDAYEETNVGRAFHFAFKCWFVLSVIAFIMLFIIPEFQKMFSEFGIELPASTQFLMAWADRAAKLWFIPFFVFVGWLCYLFFWRWKSISGYFRRWHPRLWRQPVISESVIEKRAETWAARFRSMTLSTGDPISSSNRNAALETEAWLSQHAAETFQDKSETRSRWITNAVLAVGNIFLAVVVATTCFAIYSVLITIVQGLSGT